MLLALVAASLAWPAAALELRPDPPVEGAPLVVRATEPAAAFQWTVNLGTAPPEGLRPAGTTLEERTARPIGRAGAGERALVLAVSPALRAPEGAAELRLAPLPPAVWQLCVRPRERAERGWGPLGRCAEVRPGPGLALPRFARASRAGRVRTREETLVGGVDPELLPLLPRNAATAATFDRATEAERLVFRWRSADLEQTTAESLVAELDGALEALEGFFEAPAAATRGPAAATRGPAYGIKTALCYRKGTPEPELGGHGLALGPVVYVTAPEAPRAAFVHELVHVVELRFARPRAAAGAPALVEGLARFLEYAFGGNPRRIHSEAKAVLDRRWKPLTEMSRAEFFGDPEARQPLYTLGGSLAGYLLERRGLGPLKEALRGRPFEEAYGKPGPAVEKDWLDWLGPF